MKIGFIGFFVIMINKYMYRLKYIDKIICACNVNFKYKYYYLISVCFLRKLIILGNIFLV